MDKFYEKKSYAKVNIFLKIAGRREHYHELVSRFVRVHNLFDIVRFEKGNFGEFTLEGDFGCETRYNTIYKAYLKLTEISSKTRELFKNYKVVVKKNIPEFAGLGGGSSNCAVFMIMVNEIAELGLSKDKLSKIGAAIGADVPFFIYEYDSANVTGIGEIVKPFDEEILDIRTFTPKVQCNTGKIFTSFREKFYKEVSKEQAQKLLSMKSIDILKTVSIEEANDLYLPALDNYKELRPSNYKLPKNSYFSGSGSSFFYINE
jgi:4-diphosphocytidyl-2-C-methyl-D-erythritol kinase